MATGLPETKGKANGLGPSGDRLARGHCAGSQQDRACFSHLEALQLLGLHAWAQAVGHHGCVQAGQDTEAHAVNKGGHSLWGP